MYIIYDLDTLEVIERKYSQIDNSYKELLYSYLVHNFRTERGREYATHGFARRLSMLHHILHHVFTTLPLVLPGIPQEQDTTSATMAIQSFVINVSGCIDNLAWIWVFERNISMPNGIPIPRNQVGFGKKNELLLKSLPEVFREYVESRNEWYEHLREFRDSLAHRIPFYIPPYTIDPSNEDTYKQLGIEAESHLKDHMFNEYDELKKRQSDLCFFNPVIVHSYKENSPITYFHSQMLSDFLTVEEWAKKLLENLFSPE